MNANHPMKSPKGFLLLGMSCLLLGSLWRWGMRPSPALPQDLLDGITGLLYGVSIGGLLVSIRLNRRRRPPTGPGPSRPN